MKKKTIKFLLYLCCGAHIIVHTFHDFFYSTRHIFNVIFWHWSSDNKQSLLYRGFRHNQYD